MKVSMITTVDNPFNPFTDFDEWYQYDTTQGYYTCSYLARIVKSSDELSEMDEEDAIDKAIDEIVSMNVLGIYKKISMDSKDIYKEENSGISI